MLNLQWRTFLKGAGEALAVGMLVGLATVWIQPNDIQLTWPGLAAAGVTSLKFGIFYLAGWLRTTAGVEKK